ncbi:hypothetical protein [Paenarthrobacter nitroguajacolicus]|uniref:hypothetical protein n=1 Tax=Paenarthrobacter nitroguajacolicus TaxID=211146 RepID=UPI000B2FF7A3|nr:hypothetical protein [Paenarthrobacter nitroguajacolicus]
MKREDEPKEFEIAEKYFAEVRSWLRFRDSIDPWTVPAQSQMASDDSLSAPYRTSHNIANAVVSAVDHLHTLDSLLVAAGASHTLSPFSLIRGAIETAAQAAWITAPTDPSERVFRSLCLSLKVAKDRETAYTELAAQHPQPDATLPNFEEDKAELGKILKNAGISSKLAQPTSTQILKEVRDLVPTTSVLSVWQLCSGFAHGRRWASDAVLAAKNVTNLPGGVIAKEQRPTMRLTVWSMTAAMDLTRYSINRFAELTRLDT